MLEIANVDMWAVYIEQALKLLLTYYLNNTMRFDRSREQFVPQRPVARLNIARYRIKLEPLPAQQKNAMIKKFNYIEAAQNIVK